MGLGQLALTGGDDLVAAQAEVLLRKPRAAARPYVVRDVSGGARFLERLDDECPAVWLYGAGHVGQALAPILAELPLRLTWIDSRAELFPVAHEGVRIRGDADSLATVSDAPADAYFLVMTHSHPLDFALCQAILGRNDFAWLGLIGSESKAARFRSRLKRAGVPAESLARLVCPIGVPGIESKWPAAIAVSVAAQVMQRMSAAARNRGGTGHARTVFRPAAGKDPSCSPARAKEGEATPGCEGENCSACGTSAATASDAAGVSGGSPAEEVAIPRGGARVRFAERAVHAVEPGPPVQVNEPDAAVQASELGSPMQAGELGLPVKVVESGTAEQAGEPGTPVRAGELDAPLVGSS